MYNTPSIVKNSGSGAFPAGKASDPHHTTQALGANLRPVPSLSDVSQSCGTRYHLRQTNSHTQQSNYNNLPNARIPANMKQQLPDSGDLRKTLSVCPFCSKTFKVLGKHLQYCKERKGRRYNDFLAVNSGSQRKVTKPVTSQPVHSLCPHCNQSFSRLDLHLRRNVSCSTKTYKMLVTAESQQQSHSGQITDTWSYNTFQKSEFEQSELPAFHLKPAISLPNFKQKHEWFELNQHIEVHIAPVYMQPIQ